MKWDSGLTSSYRTASTNAIDAWNAKNISPVKFYTKLDSNNVVYQTSSLGTGVYGSYLSISENNDTKHYTLKFKITYAKSCCEGSYKTQNTKQSVGVHELGHAAGLNDLTSGLSIMSGNRNREAICTPQTDDINGVNASW